MRQQTLAVAAEGNFEKYRKPTRREIFLMEMDRIVPWAHLVDLIGPHYPKAGNGRHPVGVERMLRMYFLQQWFKLPDPAVEESLYESASMRQFVGIDLGKEPVPDETTICRFRHLPVYREMWHCCIAKADRSAFVCVVRAYPYNLQTERMDPLQ